MSKTKIKAALSALDKAAKGAFKVLNEVTDGAFEGSPAEGEPMRFANEISQRLQKQYDHLEANAKYEGMSEQEIAEQRATEAVDAQAKLQELAAEKLRSLTIKGKGLTASEPEADENDESFELDQDDNDDTESDSAGGVGDQAITDAAESWTSQA